MAVEYKYKNRRALDTWVKITNLAVEHVNNRRFGRKQAGLETKGQLEALIAMVDTYDAQEACKGPVFNLTINGKPISSNFSIITHTSTVTQDERCACEDNCLSTEQIQELEDNIIEFTKNC